MASPAQKEAKTANRWVKRQYHDLLLLHRLLERYVHSSGNKKAQDACIMHIDKVIKKEYKVDAVVDKKIHDMIGKLNDDDKARLHEHLETIEKMDNHIAHYLALGSDLNRIVQSLASGTADVKMMADEIDYIIKLDQGLYHEIELIRHEVDHDLSRSLPDAYKVTTLFAFVPIFCIEEYDGKKPTGCLPSGDAEKVVVGWDPKFVEDADSLGTLLDTYSKPRDSIPRVLVKFGKDAVVKFKRRIEAGPHIYTVKERIRSNEMQRADVKEVWNIFKKFHGDDAFVKEYLLPRWREHHMQQQNIRKVA